MADDINNIDITAIDYQPGNLSVSIRTVSGLNGTMACWVGGKQYGVTSRNGSIRIGVTLTTDETLSCQVAWTCGGALGPKSPAVPILTYDVDLVYVQYDDIPDAPQVEVGWQPPATYTGTYRATLNVSGQAPVTSTTDQTSCVFILDTPLSGDDNTVSVQAFETVNDAPTSGPAATATILVG